MTTDKAFYRKMHRTLFAAFAPMLLSRDQVQDPLASFVNASRAAIGLVLLATLFARQRELQNS